MGDEMKWRYKVGDVVECGGVRVTVVKLVAGHSGPAYEVEGLANRTPFAAESELTPATPQVGDWVEREAGDGQPDAYQGEIAEEDDAFWVLNTGKYAKKEFTRVVAHPQLEPEAAPVTWKFAVGDIVESGGKRRTVKSTFERRCSPWYVLELTRGLEGEYSEDVIRPAAPQVGDWVERAGVGDHETYQGEIVANAGPKYWFAKIPGVNGNYHAPKSMCRVVARPQPEAAPEPGYVPQVGDLVAWSAKPGDRFVVIRVTADGARIFDPGTGSWAAQTSDLTLLSRHGSCDGCERLAATRVQELEAERDSVLRVVESCHRREDVAGESIGRLIAERDAAIKRAEAAEARVVELETQVSKPLTEEQAGEIRRLASASAIAQATCRLGKGCRCEETSAALIDYLASLTRPSPAPDRDAPDSTDGCRAELQAMGALVLYDEPPYDGWLPLGVYRGESRAAFGEPDGAATLSDWQAAVRWARGVKGSEAKTDG